MVSASDIISTFVNPNIGEIVKILRKLFDKLKEIPADEEIRQHQQLLLNSVKTSFKSLELFSLQIVPRLESLKKDFQLSHKILNKSGNLDDNDKEDLQAIIEEVCNHVEKMTCYKEEQKKLHNFHLDLENLKLKIASESKFRWYHNPGLLATLSGFFGSIGVSIGVGAACYFIPHAGCIGTACVLTTAGLCLAFGVGVIAFGLVSAVAYYLSRQSRKKKEEHNKVFDLIGKDLDSLQFLLKDYDKNLNDIIAQQSKIDCGVDNLKKCLKREIFIDQNKETSQDLIKILDDQINTINELLKLMQSPTVSNYFQNQ